MRNQIQQDKDIMLWWCAVLIFTVFTTAVVCGVIAGGRQLNNSEWNAERRAIYNIRHDICELRDYKTNDTDCLDKTTYLWTVVAPQRCGESLLTREERCIDTVPRHLNVIYDCFIRACRSGRFDFEFDIELRKDSQAGSPHAIAWWVLFAASICSCLACARQNHEFDKQLKKWR